MKNKIAELLSSKISELTKEEINQLIEIPKKVELGDFAFPCFRLAKVYKKAPQMIAEDLKNQLGIVDFLEKIQVEGGYLNFFVSKEQFVKEIIEQASKKNFGEGTIGKGKTVCIDYSSPNIAKNFHVGHLRTTIIGNSLYKIHEKLGYHVERINHLGDWGTQFGKLIVAYKRWGNEEAIKENGVSELMKIYVKFHDEAKKDDSLNDEARAWFTKMENQDEEALRIWKWFKEISMVEYDRIYKLLGMEFDHFTGESFYCDKTGKVVELLKEKNLLEESDGANIVNLEEYNMPPCLITKNDGSSIYATRDLAAVLYRKETYHFDKCLYVTGLEQKLHFAQVFKVIELLENDWYKDLYHIPYGLVSLEGGKLSTRSGNVIYAEEILNDAINRIKEIIEEKNPDIPEKEEVAIMVGIGAIIFNDLYNQRIKDVVFSWDKILNFDGETGPYVQYTYARAASILRKQEFNEDNEIDVDVSLITDDASIALLKEISRFPKVVEDAAEKFEPSIVARYSMAVAQSFNKFYNECKINVEDEKLKLSRIKLVILAKKVLKDSLKLLGMKCPEQM